MCCLVRYVFSGLSSPMMQSFQTNWKGCCLSCISRTFQAVLKHLTFQKIFCHNSLHWAKNGSDEVKSPNLGWLIPLSCLHWVQTCCTWHFLGRGSSIQRAIADGCTSRVWRICFRSWHPSSGSGAYTTHLWCKSAQLPAAGVCFVGCYECSKRQFMHWKMCSHCQEPFTGIGVGANS